MLNKTHLHVYIRVSFLVKFILSYNCKTSFTVVFTPLKHFQPRKTEQQNIQQIIQLMINTQLYSFVFQNNNKIMSL